MEKLDHCPFCGSENTAVDLYPVPPVYAPYYGTCKDCGSRGPRKNTLKTAIEAWNRRCGESGSDHQNDC